MADLSDLENDLKALAPAYPRRPTPRDEVRREQQKRINAGIQDEAFDPSPVLMTPEQMQQRLVFIQDGSQVCLLDNPRVAMALPDARNTFAASRVSVGEKGKTVPALDLWLKDDARQTVAKRAFMPGESTFCLGPDGHPSINTWRDFEREPVTGDVGLFLEHVAYLWPEEAERDRLMQWLAHIEQYPGVLPHYGWLHIARHTGTGRNWLASLLARVWRGHVAPNVDLPGLLDSQFNGALSERVLAIVDEVQEGGEGGYRHINRLKSLLNAETRTINPKYGRAVLERNCCRWLVFSNHENAIPLDDADRRWRVVVHDAPPREPEVYEALYKALDDPAFIGSVACYLRQLDISAFRPGERPPMNAGRAIVIEASKPAGRRAADQLIQDWRSDVITSQDAVRYLTEVVGRDQGSAARYVMQEAGARPLRSEDGRDRAVKLGGKTYRAWTLRNHDRWMMASADELRNEILAGSDQPF
jgi:hypothetical protein